jgi:uncharacterized protein DUF2188
MTGADVHERNREEPEMAEGFIHTVNKNGIWVNTVEGGDPFGATFDSKREAVTAGRDLAKANSREHVIHNEDGTNRRAQLVRQSGSRIGRRRRGSRNRATCPGRRSKL